MLLLNLDKIVVFLKFYLTMLEFVLPFQVSLYQYKKQ